MGDGCSEIDSGTHPVAVWLPAVTTGVTGTASHHRRLILFDHGALSGFQNHIRPLKTVLKGGIVSLPEHSLGQRMSQTNSDSRGKDSFDGKTMGRVKNRAHYLN